jgi:hypothetical protein
MAGYASLPGFSEINTDTQASRDAIGRFCFFCKVIQSICKISLTNVLGYR